MATLLKSMIIGVSLIVLMSLFVWALVNFVWFQLIVLFIVFLAGATSVGFMILESWRDM